jgi:hypothetical protein
MLTRGLALAEVAVGEDDADALGHFALFCNLAGGSATTACGSVRRSRCGGRSARSTARSRSRPSIRTS